MSKSRGAGEEAPAGQQPAAAHVSDAAGEEDPAERGVYAARAGAEWGHGSGARIFTGEKNVQETSYS